MFLVVSIYFQQVNVLFYLSFLFFYFFFFGLRLFSSSSKSVFVTKFVCFNPAAKFPAVNLLKSGVVIYLS